MFLLELSELILFILWSTAYSITTDDFYTVDGNLSSLDAEPNVFRSSKILVIDPPFPLYGKTYSDFIVSLTGCSATFLIAMNIIFRSVRMG